MTILGLCGQNVDKFKVLCRWKGQRLDYLVYSLGLHLSLYSQTHQELVYSSDTTSNILKKMIMSGVLIGRSRIVRVGRGERKA